MVREGISSCLDILICPLTVFDIANRSVRGNLAKHKGILPHQ